MYTGTTTEFASRHGSTWGSKSVNDCHSLDTRRWPFSSNRSPPSSNTTHAGRKGRRMG
ncbi:hypothetical protein GHT06_017776 [Daphnia sinensis]|uniref:Uncharacterized protein n=1 Tax=Daphnia sinensis TaxID=1820382 RepID=A0AAD5KLK6_9CRUS|nr:hypothetical protein GHT06_017776 [Daphnia sinensis]